MNTRTVPVEREAVEYCEKVLDHQCRELAIYNSTKEYDRARNVRRMLREALASAPPQSEPIGTKVVSVDALKSLLKQRSKGEYNTWGFVAMFLEMIDEVATIPPQSDPDYHQIALDLCHGDAARLNELAETNAALKPTDQLVLPEIIGPCSEIVERITDELGDIEGCETDQELVTQVLHAIKRLIPSGRITNAAPEQEQRTAGAGAGIAPPAPAAAPDWTDEILKPADAFLFAAAPDPMTIEGMIASERKREAAVAPFTIPSCADLTYTTAIEAAAPTIIATVACSRCGKIGSAMDDGHTCTVYGTNVTERRIGQRRNYVSNAANCPIRRFDLFDRRQNAAGRVETAVRNAEHGQPVPAAPSMETVNATSLEYGVGVPAAQIKLRAQEGLTRIAQKEREQFRAMLSAEKVRNETWDKTYNQLADVHERTVAKLARYKSVKMPEEDGRWGVSTFIDKYNNRIEIKMVPKEYADKLRACLAAQKVKADENERDARRYRWIRADSNGLDADELFHSKAMCEEALDAAIDTILKEQEK